VLLQGSATWAKFILNKNATSLVAVIIYYQKIFYFSRFLIKFIYNTFVLFMLCLSKVSLSALGVADLRTVNSFHLAPVAGEDALLQQFEQGLPVRLGRG
jgi:hypothetical protein